MRRPGHFPRMLRRYGHSLVPLPRHSHKCVSRRPIEYQMYYDICDSLPEAKLLDLRSYTVFRFKCSQPLSTKSSRWYTPVQALAQTHLVVQTLLRQKLLMCATFYDSAPREDNDHVSVFDGTEAMSHSNRRPSTLHLL
jgi:hypothetical protein